MSRTAVTSVQQRLYEQLFVEVRDMRVRLDVLDSTANKGRGAIWAIAAIAGWVGVAGLMKLLH